MNTAVTSSHNAPSHHAPALESRGLGYLFAGIWCLLCISSMRNVSLLLSKTAPTPFANHSQSLIAIIPIACDLCICLAAWFLVRAKHLPVIRALSTNAPKYYTYYATHMFCAALICCISTIWLFIFKFCVDNSDRNYVLTSSIFAYSGVFILVANVVVCFVLLPLASPPKIKEMLDFDYTLILLLSLLCGPIIVIPVMIFAISSWPSVFERFQDIWHGLANAQTYNLLICVWLFIFSIYTLFMYKRLNICAMGQCWSEERMTSYLFMIALMLMIFYSCCSVSFN
ncbi:hypothetical protein Sarmat_00202 [Rickettsiales endosymbiont of Paramecium tredecaurelia]|uniref:hypothetical protein n=1 Tax=Candidatus Sarmatiella mevalonica TaxID=2770581 RepID=UPI00192465C9|nr:hypothetical protein [Candidatus Sarmatiella mevalonica]MBL3284362.1 hypothetical protein [Candidatus Sarmatiella mevalonica]